MQAPGNHPYSHISFPEIITHPQIVPISLNPLYPEEFPTCLHQLYFSCVSAIYNYKCRRIPVIYCGREAHPMNFELSANVIGLWAKDARPHSSPAIPCQCPIQSIEFRLLFIGAWGNPILAQHKFSCSQSLPRPFSFSFSSSTHNHHFHTHFVQPLALFWEYPATNFHFFSSLETT